MRYRVKWEMDFDDAESAQEATVQAWNAMRREASIANVFEVINLTQPSLRQIVDLTEGTIRDASTDIDQTRVRSD